MAILTIGGVAMPSPTQDGYKVTLSDIDSADSGRTETGMMSRNRVRAGVAKIECDWKMLTAEECTTVLNAVSGDKLSVQYFFGSTRSATMYASDRSCEMVSLAEDGSSAWNVSFSLVEF